MDIRELIAIGSDPAIYPHGVTKVEVHQTHISAVFLAGPFAYKFKKPLRLDFLDFSTLQLRHHYCLEEVRLNRRLAPHVYLGVVPLTHSEEGYRLEGPGQPVEWAVKMERLPETARLDVELQSGRADATTIKRLARRIAVFHQEADSSEPESDEGDYLVVARNVRENLAYGASQLGITLSQAVWERLQVRTEAALSELRPLIESRAARGVHRDTHGDLRLEHVYVFPERSPPRDLAVVDCIEFNDRFRFADPVADTAFLVMDLIIHGWRNLAATFSSTYFDASGDTEGRSLLPFYTAYRAAVRGKVEGIQHGEKEIPELERIAARARARAHWLLALGQLEAPMDRPCLVLVGGLPGSGKSTLARRLAEHARFDVIRSDLVRKELAGICGQAGPRSEFGQGIYSEEWHERTYAECLRRAEDLLFEGRRVLVDASFREDRRRWQFLEAAKNWGVPALFVLCRAEPETIRARLDSRRGDASDADWRVYQEAALRWEPVSPAMRSQHRELRTDQGRAETLEHAMKILGEWGLAPSHLA